MKRERNSRHEGEVDASQRIDRLIAEIPDWRAQTLAAVRKSILAADPEIVEEWKWMGSPVWSREGIIAVGNAHKEKVKLTFANGAKLADPQKIFNNGFGGSKWRAIDLFEGDKVNERALKNLVRAAIEYNQSLSKKKVPARKPQVSRASSPDRPAAKKSRSPRSR